MTATTTDRDPLFAGEMPYHGTAPVAANTRIQKGWLVALNASGEAVAAAAANGFDAWGVCLATIDNTGGAAGDVDVEVGFGVYGFLETGTDPVSGSVMFVLDNQTVSTDSDSGARGVAGYCSEFRDGVCYTLVGPTIAGQIVIAAAEATQLDAAQVDITEIRTDLAKGFLPIQVTSFVKASDGTPLVKFADGSASGIDFSEGSSYRWVPSGEQALAAIGVTVALPPDLNEAAAIEVHMLVARVGAADTTVVLTATAFFQTIAAARTADADCGGNTAAIAEDTTLISEKTVTIAHGDVPAHPCALSLTLIPSAALDADDLCLHAVWLEFSKTVTSS